MEEDLSSTLYSEVRIPPTWSLSTSFWDLGTSLVTVENVLERILVTTSFHVDDPRNDVIPSTFQRRIVSDEVGPFVVVVAVEIDAAVVVVVVTAVAAVDVVVVDVTFRQQKD